MNQNASSRKDIRAAEKAAKLAETRAREVTTEIMSTPAGREWLWTRLVECHIFEQSFVPSDPLGSAFREGERAIGLRLLSVIMQHCPDQYVTAAREDNERSTASERARSQNGDGGDQGRLDPDEHFTSNDGPNYPNDIERWGWKSEGSLDN